MGTAKTPLVLGTSICEMRMTDGLQAVQYLSVRKPILHANQDSFCLGTGSGLTVIGMFLMSVSNILSTRHKAQKAVVLAETEKANESLAASRDTKLFDKAVTVAATAAAKQHLIHMWII